MATPKYQVEAVVENSHGEKHELNREVFAKDGATVWTWLLSLVTEVGGKLLSQRIRRIDTETGELTSDMKKLPPPLGYGYKPAHEATQKWYELVVFGTVNVEVTTSPCTYKENEDDTPPF